MSKIAPNPNMYAVGGDVQASGGVYIPRNADKALLELCLSGTFSFVLTPRQMGKSSLMKRTAERLADENVRSVIIDLTQIGTNVSAEQWYLGLLIAMEDQLGLKTDVLNWWDENKHIGMTQRLTDFFRKIMTSEVKKRVVIFIDELDTTLRLNFTDDFFAAIRYLHNSRDLVPEFKRLSFVLIGVATPSDLVRDPQRTPFNIGQRVDLTDFTPEEARPLADGLGLPPDEAQRVIGWMMEWTNGHPYLTLRLCRVVAQEGRPGWTRQDVEGIVKRTFFNDQSEQDNNLHFVRDMLTARAPDRTAVMTTYLDVLRGRARVYDEEQSLIKTHLKLSGVVYREGRVLHVRNRIYGETFDQKWVKEQLPQTLRRRLRRTAIISGATTTLAFIGLLLIPLTLWAFASRAQAVTARDEAEKSRLEALDAKAEADRQRVIAVRERERAENLTDTQALLIRESEGRRVDAEEQRAEAEKQREIALDAVTKAQQAQQQADALRLEAHTRQLGAFAELTRNQQARLLKRSVLLARESMEVPSEIGYQALNNGLALLPHPVARLDQTVAVTSLAFSADGGSLVTFGNPDQSQVRTRAIGSWTINRGVVGDPAFAANKPGMGFMSPSMKYEIDGVRVIEVRTGREIGKLDVTPLHPPIFSPDPESQYVLFASDGTALVFEMATARLVFKQSPTSGKYVASEGRANFGSYVASFSATGKYLAITGFYGQGYKVHVLESANGAEVANLDLDFKPLQILFSPDQQGKLLAIVGEDHTSVRFWDLGTQKEVGRVFHKGVIDKIMFSPDGNYLATAGGIDNTARVWETATGRELAHLTHEADVFDVAFSPDGEYLVTASADATARVWDWQGGSEVTRMIHEGPVTSVAFDPNGEYVATGSSDKTARVWEFAKGSNMINLKRGLKTSDRSFTISPTGNYVAASGPNGVRLLDPNGGREIRRLAVPGIAWMLTSANGKYLAAFTQKNEITSLQWWDTESGMPVTEREKVEDPSDEGVIAISPDGNYLIFMTSVTDSDGNRPSSMLKIKRKSDGRQLWQVQKGNIEADDFRRIMTFSPNSRFFVAGFKTSDDKSTVRVYETQTGREVVLAGVRLNHLAAFSPDSKYLATTTDTGNTVNIWSTETWRMTAALSENQGDINQIVFNPAGTLIAVASSGNAATVWHADAARWETSGAVRLIRKVTHEGAVTNVAISHDSKYLATSGDDETTRVWALDSAREVGRVTTSDGVIQLAFSTNDKILLISTHEDSGFFDLFDFIATDAQLWLWSPEALLGETCARLIPNLTLDDWQQYEEWHKATIGTPPLRTCHNLPSPPSKRDSMRK